MKPHELFKLFEQVLNKVKMAALYIGAVVAWLWFLHTISFGILFTGT